MCTRNCCSQGVSGIGSVTTAEAEKAVAVTVPSEFRRLKAARTCGFRMRGDAFSSSNKKILGSATYVRPVQEETRDPNPVQIP